MLILKGNHSFLVSGSDKIICNQYQMTIMPKKLQTLDEDINKTACVSLEIGLKFMETTG